MLELRICGGIEADVDGRPVPEALLGGRQGRLVLAYLTCARDRAVRRDELADLLWPGEVPESWTASLSAVVSRLRRLFTEAGFDGPAVIASTPGGYQLVLPEGTRVDLDELVDAVEEAEAAAGAGDAARALAAAARAEAIASRGFLADDCEWVDARRLALRELHVRAVVARSVAHRGAGSAARAIEAARRALELDDTREAAYRELMAALALAGERAEALRVWERCRIALVEEFGVDPSPETEAVYLGLLDSAVAPTGVTPPAQLPSGVVTFLLTDIVGSSALWEDQAAAMAAALERHDVIVGAVVAGHGGTLLKSKLEGDATVSVFARATECAAAALALVDAVESEAWPDGARPRLRIAMHTGEAFERAGDYFGPALNRAARLRALAGANEVVLSQAVAELVRDHLPDGVALGDRGLQHLRGLTRGEHVFTLVRAGIGGGADAPAGPAAEPALSRSLPAALATTGPFVGRTRELDVLATRWDRAAAGEVGAVLVAGEPGVGKSRLAGEIARRVHDGGGLVLYGRCDEDLAAPLQPFIEAARTLAPALGAARLRRVRGVDELTRVLPELTDLLGDSDVRADPDTERLALFDAVTQLLVVAAAEAPVLLVLDDLHWAGKTTLSLLRHLLRSARGTALLVVGTYRDTELARTHPLAETLADLRRDTETERVTLSGLTVDDVEAYLTAIGNTDAALGRELAEVTAGNPFFLIEVVRHVEESGGSWQPGTLPEGVREATGRRLSRLSDAANEALAVAAVVGPSFDLALVEALQGVELVDPIAEAVQAGLVLEEPGSLARFRFAHAIVRQVLLAELVSLKRVRLHRAIAELLDATPAGVDPDRRLADLAHHWFECASAGSAQPAVAACRRAGDRAMERLAHEEAGDLYGMALQALEWVDGADAETVAALHLARCDALLTAGDVTGAGAAIDALELAAAGSERLAAWYTTYEGLLAVLGEPERLTEIVESIGAAAGAMRDAGDLTGEAKARYVHASALERLGRIGPAERALDAALAAARASRDRRLADAILAEAPPAALWGPSPVTRASGRCLDVVRVLRITSGTPAVEAVALRCQAVLEALRGRMDAARRMIGSARRTVEELGLTHRRLETELAAGLIELLDGEAVAAEQLLQGAYEGLRERGLGGEAAQAGAYLGRALLLQERVDEADAAAARAEALAGSDLKAAITWRTVRAEVAARRGDTARARALADEAVELASATDALLLVADARLTLAAVLRIAGDATAAAAEAGRAAEACEAKGATVLAAVARDAMGTSSAAVTAPEPQAAPAGDASEGNLAMVYAHRFLDAFNRGDWDAVGADIAPGRVVDDRRPIVGMTVFDYDWQQNAYIHAGGGRFDPPEVLATRGDRIALCRWVLRGPGMEVPYLAITRVNAAGHIVDYVMFEPEAMDEAVAELDQMAAANPLENDATRGATQLQAAFNTGDWDAVVARHTDGYTIEERRSFMKYSLGLDEYLDTMRVIFDGGGTLTTEILATRGRRAFVARCTLRVPAPEAVATVLTAATTDEQGRYTRTVTFDPEDVGAALAELDRLYRAEEGAEDPGDNTAWRAALRHRDAFDRGDWEAYLEATDPAFVYADHRRAIQLRLEGPAAFDAMRFDLAVDNLRYQRAPVATRGDHLVLTRDVAWFVDGEAGPSEVEVVTLVESGPDGRVRAHTAFDVDDLDTAMDALEARHAELAAAVDAGAETLRAAPVAPGGDWAENEAWRAQLRFRDTSNRRDWAGFLDTVDPALVSADLRPAVRLRLEGADAIDSYRHLFEIDDYRFGCELLATRGDRLALTRVCIWFRDGDVGPAEVETLSVVECGTDGRITAIKAVGPGDVDAALDVLDDCYVAQGGPDLSAMRHSFDARDWDTFAAGFAPDCAVVDGRTAGWGAIDRETFVDYQRRVVELSPDAHLWIDHTRTRGDVAISTGRAFGTRDGGPWEIAFVSVGVAGPDGVSRRFESYELADMAVAIQRFEALTAEAEPA